MDEIDNQFLAKLGADVPVCYYGKNCLATGIGEKIIKNIYFPKFYFVLVKPKINLSDIGMVTETDVTLAKASNAVLLAFNVKASKAIPITFI